MLHQIKLSLMSQLQMTSVDIMRARAPRGRGPEGSMHQMQGAYRFCTDYYSTSLIAFVRPLRYLKPQENLHSHQKMRKCVNIGFGHGRGVINASK